MPEMAFHEYVPSPGSMAAQIVDIKSATRQKYVRATNRDVIYPYKALQPENGCADLTVLLGLYPNDALKGIASALQSDIQKNVKKELLIPAVSDEIIRNFIELMKIIDESMFRILVKFRNRQTVHLRELMALSSYVNYLLLRGYLFRCLSRDNEVLVMPRELLLVLEALDEAETGRIVKKNTAICKMGTSILYYYGVLDEGDFFLYLNTMFRNMVKGRMAEKVSLTGLSYTDYFKNKEIYQSTDRVFKNYARYGRAVREVCFNDNYYRRYFCHYSVFNPFNVYFEQQQREDLDFLPLSCNDLLAERMADAGAKDAMREYLAGHFRLDSFKANSLVEQWSCYIKNGENQSACLSIIAEQLKFKSADKLNEMLSFSSVYFMNELNQWRIKGHTPNELKGIMLAERRKQAALRRPADKTEEAAGKAGRNDPCPCGSGKKYKKCCIDRNAR